MTDHGDPEDGEESLRARPKPPRRGEVGLAEDAVAAETWPQITWAGGRDKRNEGQAFANVDASSDRNSLPNYIARPTVILFSAIVGRPCTLTAVSAFRGPSFPFLPPSVGDCLVALDLAIVRVFEESGPDSD